MGESENDVEVRDGEEFGLAFFKPSLSGDVLTLGAVSIAARMIEDTLCAAVGAPFDVTSQCGGAAGQDGGDGPPVRGQQAGAILPLIRRPVPAQNFGQWDQRPEL